MKIEEALHKIITFKNNSSIENFVKYYDKFIPVLSDLKSRDFTENQKELIENVLDATILKLESPIEKKELYAAFEEFKKFLNEKLSLIPEGYYTSYGVVFGMLTGVVVQMYFGYLSMLIGMGIGLIIGMVLDAEAQKQGRVYKTKVSKSINDEINIH